MTLRKIKDDDQIPLKGGERFHTWPDDTHQASGDCWCDPIPVTLDSPPYPPDVVIYKHRKVS